MRRIYMDANATTPLLPEVFAAMHPFFLEHYGNASSIHQQGQHARAAVDHARDEIAHLLHCRTSEIVFTSGGTESDNFALFGTVTSELSATKEKTHVITTSIEHHAVLHAAASLEHRNIDVTFLPCTPEGLIEPASLIAAIRPNTKLVSVMLANNETGVVQPIAALAAIAHAAGALFHTDAVQAGGKLDLDLSPKGALKDVDLLTLSGHKLYAPKGIGILFVRRSVRLNPMFHGGSHERQRRAGTENVTGIVGLGKAASLAQTWLTEDSPADGPTHLAALRDRLEQGILAQVEECGVNGGGAPRVSNTSSIFFDHVEAEALVIALDLKGLSVSGGSACQSGATEPSHVLTAMGLSAARARASIRFSLSRLTTEEEISEALELIPAAVARLRELSPTWHRQEPAVV
ncbi:cysteine desulfurase family protein [Granulicella sp. L60]|uniref:cysteine desulfurase family protein n=1 Tax=Granulicella sp. L60 TaxID=1641866 RepID=UPI00131E393B|nr:cysteine desulfurase family protein [Granulicella sp. L60]